LDTIVVRVEAAPEEGPYTEVLGRSIGIEGLREIEVGKLRQAFSRLSTQISEVLQDIKAVGAFHLKAVEVEVEVSSEGGVNLVGSLKAGVKGAIKLTFSE
jgi:hypothetical protein